MRIPAKKSEFDPIRTATLVVAGSLFPVWLIAVVLALVTIALYWPAMNCDFINLDDPVYVTANSHVQGGLTWEGVKWAFGSMQQGTLWAPLLWLSHMLACQLFGLNPWGHHLVNVLLHAANTALVFLVFQRTTGATWRSLMLAALFGWHPLRVESVAWVTERKDVLSTLFWMLTLLAYAKYVEAGQIQDSKSKAWYGAALMVFVCGLMSKAMLVTMPFVLLLLDYWPLERFKPGSLWRLVREKIPFFALAAAASVMTFVVQKQAGAVMTAEYLPLGARVGNALISYCQYLKKMFWPVDLAVYYQHPGHWPLEQVVAAGVFLCGVSLILFFKRNQHPFLLVGWLWFVGTLVPVIGLVQVGGQAMADRYTYIPSLGILIIAIWGAYELTRGWRYQAPGLLVGGSVAIVLCLALTRQQLGYWRDSETLFQHTLEVTQNNYFARKALGDAFDDKGQTGEAILQYQEAIRLNQGFGPAHINLGNALLKQGRIREAVGQFQEAIRLKPDDALAHNNLGNALDKNGQAGEAVGQFQEAIRLKPDYAEAHFNLGLVLGREGQNDGAISQYQEAIRLDPGNAEARINLGIALFKEGQTDEAISQYREAIRLKPEDADAHYNLGNALINHGQIGEAISQYQETIRLKPDDADAHINLGVALFSQGRTDGAVKQFQAAIRLKPDYTEARINLGNALLNQGQTDGAIRQFQEALRIEPDNAGVKASLANALAQKNKSNVRTSGPVEP